MSPPVVGSPPPATAEAVLPKSLEWWLDGLKWLVAIGAGAIAFGMASLEKTGFWGAYLAFALYGPLLAFGSAVGVFYLFNRYYHSGLRELGKAADETEEVHQANLARYLKRSKAFYRLTVWSLSLGMLLFAVFAGAYVWDLWRKQTDERVLAVQALPPGGPDLAIAQTHGRGYLLHRRPDGSLVWRPLKPPP
ncbi:hypothetical protein [Phenylobacterium sp.]|uniref:hypothetical protein n=1 Tax=Phenylobacterium sp. TaxID=1871053 RepID=UPI002632ED3B|nr:hypothetical protein [Phenylobacterium sp.]